MGSTGQHPSVMANVGKWPATVAFSTPPVLPFFLPDAASKRFLPFFAHQMSSGACVFLWKLAFSLDAGLLI